MHTFASDYNDLQFFKYIFMNCYCLGIYMDRELNCHLIINNKKLKQYFGWKSLSAKAIL